MITFLPPQTDASPIPPHRSTSIPIDHVTSQASSQWAYGCGRAVSKRAVHAERLDTASDASQSKGYEVVASTSHEVAPPRHLPVCISYGALQPRWGSDEIALNHALHINHFPLQADIETRVPPKCAAGASIH